MHWHSNIFWNSQFYLLCRSKQFGLNMCNVCSVPSDWIPDILVQTFSFVRDKNTGIDTFIKRKLGLESSHELFYTKMTQPCQSKIHLKFPNTKICTWKCHGSTWYHCIDHNYEPYLPCFISIFFLLVSLFEEWSKSPIEIWETDSFHISVSTLHLHCVTEVI